jgi:hypothetical protein
MPTTYGCTRTFGEWTFTVDGMPSREAALEDVHRRAFEKGVWKPRPLREKWWQFWRPTEHTEIEKKFINE